MPSPFHRFVRAVADLPLAERVTSRLPEGVQQALTEVLAAFREEPTTDEHVVVEKAVTEGQVARGLYLLLHDVREGGTVRAVNVMHGDIDGGVVKGCNVLDGDVRSGELGGANVVYGDVYEGSVRGINVLVGDIHGGDVRGVNALVGDIRGGTVHDVHVVVGDVYGGRVRDCACLVGDVRGGSVHVARHAGRVHGGEVEAEHSHRGGKD